MNATKYNGLSLTMIVNRLAAIQQEEIMAGEEMDAFHAPSECWDLITPGIDRARKQILDQAGLTADEYDAILQSRTTPHWAHFHGPRSS